MLARLRLFDFRNFHRLDWRPPAARLLLAGRNGAGKTTLLEAVYLAATGRSFRAPRLAVCRRHGAAEFAVRAEVGVRPTRELALAWRDGLAERTLDGKPAPLAEHVAVLPVLAWTEAEAELLTGGPALRRRFLDRALVHLRPALLTDLARYQRALAAKRALLAEGDGQGIEAWDELLARHGAPLAAARAGLVAALARELAALVARHAPELPPLGLAYRPASVEALAGEAELGRALAAARARERARRLPLVGPHRDELELTWDGAPVRQAASAGERKLLGLLLLAAQARHLGVAGRAPLVLVDDADAELDAGRVARVAAAFAEFPALVLTTSRPEVWTASAAPTALAVERLGSGAAATPKEGS